MKQVSQNILHLSVNSRLAQFLKSYLIGGSLAKLQVAITPNITTWQAFWRSWQDQQLLLGQLSLANLPSKVLSSFEAQLVWESLLSKSNVSALLNQAETAKKLYQAWVFFNEYLDDELLDEQFQSEEVSLFLALKAQYLDFLNKHNYWDESLQIQQQLRWFAESSVSFTEIHLHGFDEVTPYLQQWLNCLVEKGVTVKHVPQFEQVKPQKDMLLLSTSDEMSEAQQAASWAFGLVQDGQKNIAIVAPNIEEVQQNLTWALDELAWKNQQILLQSQQQNWQGSPVYNVSLGQSLSSFALIKHGLSLVKVLLSAEKKVNYEFFSNWLISPYTTGDILARQNLDVSLRRWQWAKVSIKQMLEFMKAGKENVQFPKILQEKLVSSLKTAQGGSKISSVEFVNSLLSCFSSMDWANKVGSRALTSHEFQQKEAFLHSLEAFKNQIFPKKQQTMQNWLSLLERFLTEQVFQPKNVGESPIQIMGMLEAGGQQFDGLWVMGMTGEAWAREANPNPFLPMALQREYKIPRADASRELLYAQTLTQRLSKSSANIVWSYSQMIEGREQILSPVLNTFKNQFKSFNSVRYQTLAEQSLSNFNSNAKPVEKHLDNQAPPLKEGTEVKGGSGFIAAQAICPLMAFFDYRLATKTQLEAVEDGVQKNQLGSLIHRVLELFWQEVKTQSCLISLADKLESVVDKIIADELEKVKNSYDEHFLQLEHKRILSLVLEWLELEKTRPIFKVVGFEEEYQLNIEGLVFSIKIDRIDEVEGRTLIIDYKTGVASVVEIKKNPIQKPQLAVYLHAPIQDVAGFGYGLIHSDDGVRLSMFSENNELINAQVKLEKETENEKSIFYQCTWQETIDHLKQQITDLVVSIRVGNADLNYEKEDDLKYAGCLLALRLPESKNR